MTRTAIEEFHQQIGGARRPRGFLCERGDGGKCGEEPRGWRELGEGGEHAEKGQKRLFVARVEGSKCVIDQGLKSGGQEGVGEEAAAEEHREEVRAHLSQGVVVEDPGVDGGGKRSQRGKR